MVDFFCGKCRQIYLTWIIYGIHSFNHLTNAHQQKINNNKNKNKNKNNNNNKNNKKDNDNDNDKNNNNKGFEKTVSFQTFGCLGMVFYSAKNSLEAPKSRVPNQKFLDVLVNQSKIIHNMSPYLKSCCNTPLEHTHTPIASMGLVNIYLPLVFFFVVNVGKYTLHGPCMGYTLSII